MPALRAFGRRYASPDRPSTRIPNFSLSLCLVIRARSAASWLVADDDMAVVAICPAFIHFAFIPALIAWFAIVRNPETSCEEQMQYTVAFSGILVSYTISFLVESAMIVVGFRGSPLRGGSRRRVISRLVEVDTFSHAIQLAFVVYLTYLGVATFKKACFTTAAWNDDAFVWSVVGVFYTYCLFFLVFLVFCWDYSGKHRHANECWDRTYMNCLWLSVLWFGWNPFSGASRRWHRERAARFGKNMKSLFGHCDMSVTDVVLAFMDARHRAKHAEAVEMGGFGTEGSSGSGLTACLLERGATESSVVDSPVMTVESLLAGVYRDRQIPGDPVESAVLEDAAYHYKYALAAYGWMLYFLGRGVLRGLWAVLFGGKGTYFPMFTGKANVEIACREIDTARSNILFLREQGQEDNVLCYVIAVDHQRKVVVVAVRGAITVDDNIRDLLLEPGELDGYLDAASKGSWEVRPPKVERVGDLRGSGKLVAQGDYLESCRATLCDILDCGVLEGALKDNEGYALTFTGHSLGAVGSFFLGLYFEKWVPNVRCWCFSPPAGLVDISVAESCASWCTSIMNGKEIVPRFSAANLDRARDELVCSLVSVSVSKWRRIRRLIWKYWDVYRGDQDVTKPLNPATLSEDAREFLEDYVCSRNADQHRRYLVEAADMMSLPGRIIYFEPKPEDVDREGDTAKVDMDGGNGDGDASGDSHLRGLSRLWSGFHLRIGFEMVMPDQRRCVPKYVKNASVKAQGIILSGRLIHDHMPDQLADVIKSVTSNLESQDSSASECT
jgi:hypothetical protein